MSRLVCILAVLVTIVGVTLATPVLNMSEREEALQDLLKGKLFDMLFGSEEQEELTEAPTTPQPLKEEPLQINGGSGLSSGQICSMAQSLFPKSEYVESKRDLIVNMIYHICLPSVGPEDLEAIGLILSFLREEEEDIGEVLVPTTTEPEEEKPSSSLMSLLDKLSQALDNEETGDEEEVEEEATTPAAPEDNGDDADADADAAADADADAGADAGAAADAGADGADAVAETATDGADTGINGEGGQATDVPPAKRRNDEDFLRLLLKAVEMNDKNYYI